jgi:hypothetical protein
MSLALIIQSTLGHGRVNSRILGYVFIIFLFRGSYFSWSFDNYIFLAFVPAPRGAVVYDNADIQKKSAILDNRGKSVIYCWENYLNGNLCVGSSIDLGRIFRQYYNADRLLTGPEVNTPISRALLKYGYSNFRLKILEYCDPKEIIKRVSWPKGGPREWLGAPRNVGAARPRTIFYWFIRTKI